MPSSGTRAAAGPALRVRERAWRVLLEIEDASGDALTLAGCEIGGGVCDVDRREQPPERTRRDRLLHPVVAFAFLFTLDQPLALGERPADVDLIDADPIAVQQRGCIPGERHQAALRHRIGAELRLADV